MHYDFGGHSPKCAVRLILPWLGVDVTVFDIFDSGFFIPLDVWVWACFVCFGIDLVHSASTKCIPNHKMRKCSIKAVLFLCAHIKI